jgi:hypothetical protein
MPAALRLAALAAVAASAACSGEAPLAPAGATPEKQFIFEGVRLEERRGREVSWLGTARRAAGDLASADCEGIHLRHFPNEPSGKDVFDVFAPTGQLGFDDQRATLEKVRIVTPQGGVIRGGTAQYDGSKDHVTIAGPLDFTAPGLHATASSGEIRLKENTLSVAGPVQGTFDPSAPRSAPAGGRR